MNKTSFCLGFYLIESVISPRCFLGTALVFLDVLAGQLLEKSETDTSSTRKSDVGLLSLSNNEDVVQTSGERLLGQILHDLATEVGKENEDQNNWLG